MFVVLLIATYFVSSSYGKNLILNNFYSNDITPDSIPPDINEEEEVIDDTTMYTDGKDIIYEFNDSLPPYDSTMEGLRTLPLTFGVINAHLGGSPKPINRGIYGFHIGGMFDNSTLRNDDDDANDYAWQWLIDLAPEVLRFPSGSYSKFMHLLRDPYTNADAVGYGYNIFEIARYFDWTDGEMNYDFNALSALDINDIFYGDDAQLSTWIRDEPGASRVDDYKKYRIKCFNQACETRRYIDDFIDLVNQIDDAYPGRPKTKVILNLNILSETATECRAIADYLRTNDVNVVGVEMGNETYAGFFCDAIEFHNFTNYFNFIQGTNLTGNENVLTDLPGTSSDMFGDHDFITKFKTGGGYNYKIGVCGMPLGNEYAFRLEAGAEICPESNSWNLALRDKYEETVDGTSKYKFDAVIMHTYYEPDNWQDIPITNLIPELDSCAGESETWQFDEYDTRLQNAFNKIIGIDGEPGNFRDFLVRGTSGYKAFKPSFNKFNEYFEFNLTTPEKKELWVTEWNLKSSNKNLTPANQAKVDIYNNSFTHGHLLMQWWLKNIKINFDPDYRQNFFTYATLQNFAGGTSTDLITPSDDIERDYFNISGCPFTGECGEGCSWDTEFDERNYHVRRTTYFVAHVFSNINKLNLKYLPSTYWLGYGNLNVAPTSFIDKDNTFVYIYFSNVKGDYQNYVIDPDNLISLFPTASQVELGEATITYLQADQLYSTSGKSPLFDKIDINTCYASFDHPFEITPITEAGITPTIITEANVPQCTAEDLPVNGCLSAPAYSIGYFKIPIYPTPELKIAASAFTYDFDIYPNPASKTFTIKPITEGNPSIISDFQVHIYSMSGINVLNTKCKQNGKVDISKLPSGCYQAVLIDDNNKRFYKKLIKIE